MDNLLPSLAEYKPEQDYVLAIVTGTDGSTYRKTGAMILIAQSLNYWGLISGGCLEGDIQENAAKVFQLRADMPLEYDMRGDDDLLWGMGSGCNGAVNLLLKFLPAKNNHLGFFEILHAVNNGKNYLMQVNAAQSNELVFKALANRPGQSGPGLSDADLTKACWNEDQTILSIPLLAPLNLLICGGSPDVPPVTSIARQLGWKTTVIDHRAEFATHAKFPQADQVALVKRGEWVDYTLDQFDAAVIMSHQFERDQAYLERLIQSEISYIGLLGPSKRRDRLLAECKTHFSAFEGRIFGPVGLDIGADTPQTIALAILAEIQAVRANKQVGFCYQDETR